jgi:hypothetical protein
VTSQSHEENALAAADVSPSGLASSAEVDERYVQKQLGHASAEMTRKYQRRRDRFRINLTKAAGAVKFPALTLDRCFHHADFPFFAA